MHVFCGTFGRRSLITVKLDIETMIAWIGTSSNWFWRALNFIIDRSVGFWDVFPILRHWHIHEFLPIYCCVSIVVFRRSSPCSLTFSLLALWSIKGPLDGNLESGAHVLLWESSQSFIYFFEDDCLLFGWQWGMICIVRIVRDYYVVLG